MKSYSGPIVPIHGFNINDQLEIIDDIYKKYNVFEINMELLGFKGGQRFPVQKSKLSNKDSGITYPFISVGFFANALLSNLYLNVEGFDSDIYIRNKFLDSSEAVLPLEVIDGITLEKGVDFFFQDLPSDIPEFKTIEDIVYSVSEEIFKQVGVDRIKNRILNLNIERGEYIILEDLGNVYEYRWNEATFLSQNEKEDVKINPTPDEVYTLATRGIINPCSYVKWLSKKNKSKG